MTSPRLPIPGSDEGQWGQILNDFLMQAHNANGTLKPLSYTDLQNKPVIPDTSNLVSNTALDGASASLVGNTASQTNAALKAAFAPLVSLTKYGLTNTTTDIKPIFDAAVAAGARHVLVPYRAAAWPSLSKILLTNMWVEFEDGARISFDHDQSGMELTGCRLTRGSFTSIYTGPSTAADATSTYYAYPAREVLLHDNCIVDGSYYHEYAVTGIHCHGAHIRLSCPITIKHIRHQRGWGQAVHNESTSCYDMRCSGAVYVEDSDRAIETEDGAYDVVFTGGGHIKNVFPNGYAGQASAVTYENYTFILNAHSHQGGGGVQGIAYDGTWVIENCGGGVEFVRSSGTNDSDMPRDCRVEEVRFVGRGLATGYEDIALQGRNNRVERVHFEAGAGIAGGTFRIQGYVSSINNSVGTVAVEGTATPTIADAGNGLMVRGFPVPLPSSLRTGTFISLPNRSVTTSNALGNGTFRSVPIYFPVPVTIDQLGTEITVVGDAGCTVRIGIYADNNGLPGSVLADVSVAADTVAIPMATLATPVTLTQGWYHIGGVVQGVTSVQPTVRVTVTPHGDYPIFNPSPNSTTPVGYSRGNVTGALTTWGTSIATTNIAPRIWARVTG